MFNYEKSVEGYACEDRVVLAHSRVYPSAFACCTRVDFNGIDVGDRKSSYGDGCAMETPQNIQKKNYVNKICTNFTLMCCIFICQ